MAVKKLLIGLAFLFNRWLPLFGKDSIYRYELGAKRIIKLPLNHRKFGMQYWCDFNSNTFVSRYSDYLYRKQIGLLFHCSNSWKIKRDVILTDQTLICPRFYEEDLFILKPAQSKKSKVIHFDSGNIVGMLDGCWFEVFEWKGQHYLTSKSELFKIEKSSSSQFSLTFVGNTEMPQNCQECSICSFKEILVHVLGEGGSAFGHI